MALDIFDVEYLMKYPSLMFSIFGFITNLIHVFFLTRDLKNNPIFVCLTVICVMDLVYLATVAVDETVAVLNYIDHKNCIAAEVLPRAAPVADPWFLPRAPLVPRVCTVLGRPLTSFLLPVCKTETGTSVESLSEEWSVRNRIRHNWNTWEYTEGEEMTEDEEYTEGEEMTVDEDYTEEE
ncbi:hypothetical protein GCK72_006877 [Caenorhabditis remanei]|uniref:Uncharacterized protein n=1 Tax=Caenorhabditis remanei TaxID=31234 RepID=A0A6A5HHR2_CAERE|nr:hypothetical protein GCK72_006877 [Caenorhabditis remanei]KAF1766919.1 hypothetical protein GCK72_006877 [Caenorhabditis remanei]